MNKYTGIAQLIYSLEPASSYQLLSQATRTSGIYPGLLRMNKTWLFHLENTTCLSPSGSSFKNPKRTYHGVHVVKLTD